MKKVNEPIIPGVGTTSQNGFTVSDAFPNPTHDFATINYTLPTGGAIDFTLTDIAGRVITQQTQQNMAAGNHNIRISSAQLPNGVYLYTLGSNGNTVTKRLIVAH